MKLEFSVLFNNGQRAQFSVSAEIALDVVQHMTKMKDVLQITKIEAIEIELYPR
ncbi:hypothetical protein NT239_15495 [Chitinibacter sp. SCUT-21]|uniref:hypothetical protein n=1 Tax=Chitinibacter sp. SCUT-21 TaxID=2970891 RepID=UPI0035A5CDCF